MSGTVSGLWRHPIKSHGREALSQVTVIPGQTMPGDRVWAVAHEAAKTDGSNWAPLFQFQPLFESAAADGHFGRITGRPGHIAPPTATGIDF